MKIHLHGDSWCYLWPRHYDETIDDSIKFKGSVPELLAKNQPGVVAFNPIGNTEDAPFGHEIKNSHAVDFYALMFNHLGHELINGGVPGLDLSTTVDWIAHSELQSDADIHIVMAPFMYRHADALAKIPKHILSTTDLLNEWMADEQVKQIQKISDHAAATKTHYIIIGAHGPLSGKCDTVLNEYSHIMYYDWLSEFNWEVAPSYARELKRIRKNPEYFRWATSIDYKKVHLEAWGEDVIGMVSNHLESGRGPGVLWKLIFPDNGHPNAMVMLDMVNKIIRYADKLGVN